MREKVRNDIIARVEKIQSGTFNTDDIRLLFIDIRDSLDATNNRAAAGLLYDVFDSCAHPNARKRGDIFKYSRAQCRDFVQAIKLGGTVSANFDLNATQLLTASLQALGIPHDQDLMKKQAHEISHAVFEILNDTELMVKDSDKDDIVASCSVSYDEKTHMLFVSFKLRPFTITRSDNLTISNDGATFNFRLI